MDKKYKGAIPSVINNLPAHSLADEDSNVLIAELLKKVRKTKRQKIGKDGLYSGEEVNISRWWMSRDVSIMPSESQDGAEDLTRASLLELRTRETQMQIILLLEALALEASVPATGILPERAADLEDDSQVKKENQRNHRISMSY